MSKPEYAITAEEALEDHKANAEADYRDGRHELTTQIMLAALQGNGGMWGKPEAMVSDCQALAEELHASWNNPLPEGWSA